MAHVARFAASNMGLCSNVRRGPAEFVGAAGLFDRLLGEAVGEEGHAEGSLVDLLLRRSGVGEGPACEDAGVPELVRELV